MRVWLVHPSELDTQRIAAQHQEVHCMLGIIRYNRSKPKFKLSGVCAPWNNARGITALIHLHEILVDLFDDMGWMHESPYSAQMTEKMTELFAEGLSEGPIPYNKWPLDWMDPKEVARDLMDLHIRWAREKKERELTLSQERWQGIFEGGALGGSITSLELVPDEYVQRVRTVLGEQVSAQYP